MDNKYTKEERAKIKQYLKELSAEAQWIGEDGNATCISSTKRGALLKFKRLMRGDVGDIEAEKLKLEDVGIGYLHLATELTEQERVEMEESEWYVSWFAPEKNPYEVWVLNI